MSIHRLVLLALCSSALACTVSPLPSSSPTPAGSSSGIEEPRVRAAVDRYLHGLELNDVASGFAASAGMEEEGELAIASVDVSGDVAAVKVVETYPKEVYVDYLNLVLARGDWRIVNKVHTRWSR